MDALTVLLVVEGLCIIGLAAAVSIDRVRQKTILEETHRAQVRESFNEQLVRAVSEVARDHVIVVSRDGTIIDLNKEAAAMGRRKREEGVKQAAGQAFDEKQQHTDWQSVQRVFDTGEPEHTESHRRLKGGKRWMETWLVPIKDENGDVTSVVISARDVTKWKEAEETLKGSRNFYRNLFESFPAPILQYNTKDHTVYANDAAVHFTGLEREELRGDGWARLLLPEDIAAREDGLTAARRGEPARIEYRMRRYDGSTRWVVERILPMQGPGIVKGSFSIVLDITEQKLKTEEISYLATHDSLTHLINRRVFEDALRRAISRANRGVSSALLFIDVDDFKDINDRYGHRDGDKTLVKVTKVIESLMRSGDLLARFGGDEFTILLEGADLKRPWQRPNVCATRPSRPLSDQVTSD